MAIIAVIFIGFPALEAAPKAPQWATVAAVPGDGRVSLNWLPAEGATGYRLRFRTSNSSEAWTEIRNLASNVTTYTVTGLNNFQSYEFLVASTGGPGGASDSAAW